MDIKELLELSGVILGSLGGAAAIIFGFSSWLGKVWANRLMTKEKAEYAQELESIKNRLVQDTESHKIKLKKSEFLFQKEFEAASGFVEFRQSILPEHYMPEMDWGDVEEDIANNFDRMEKWLKSFLGSHGAILPNEVKDLIELSIYKAGSNKHYEKPNAPKAARNAAVEVYKVIEEIEGKLIEKVQRQSST